MAHKILAWQSKVVLLLVMPYVAANLVLETHWWGTHDMPLAIWTIGLSLLLGLVVLKLRAATPMAAATGFTITACLMFSTASFPYEPWYTALVPVLAVSVLAHIATRIGRGKKEQMGIAERRRGRTASQVAANLGIAALVSSELAQSLLADGGWLSHSAPSHSPVFALGIAALSEAAADTVSSELGQILSSQPRMITTLKKAAPGVDGAISWEGTVAGIIAAGIVSALGAWSLRGDETLFVIGWAGAVLGLFFDSLLGATLERRGWLNNDAVNFLSTASATCFALIVIALLPLFHSV
ncbi:MAG TPA: DUF92 domain-containing protein [Terracidiphilus sp.]|nr:DUF92 domain-containing protein [Terracidiphilus sp.]